MREGMCLASASLAQAVHKGVTETAVIRFDLTPMNAGLTMCREGAIAIDSVECIGKVLLGRPNHRLIDLQMCPDLEKCQKEIKEAFRSLHLPKRAFVYLAWTPEPEVFYYVGQGGSDARLNLSKHGKLAASINHASTLSLMFPGRSDDVGDLEGSVMQIVKAVTGKLPLHNKVEGFPPLGDGASTLRRFGEVLTGVGYEISAPYDDED